MSGKKNVIIGYSGHAYVVAESFLSNENRLHYYTDLGKTTHNPYKLEYLGCESELDFKGWQMDLTFILGVGNNNLREKVLVACQIGKKRSLSTKELLISFFTHPLMTFKIITAIHFEALRLWQKGAIFQKRKVKTKNNMSFEK